MSAFKINARLLMLFEEGNCVTVPKIFELPFIVIDEFKSLSHLCDVKSNFSKCFFCRIETIYFETKLKQV